MKKVPPKKHKENRYGLCTDPQKLDLKSNDWRSVFLILKNFSKTYQFGRGILKNKGVIYIVKKYFKGPDFNRSVIMKDFYSHRRKEN